MPYEAKKDPSTKIVGDIYTVRREVEKTYPPSRERSLVLTKLDEATMWLRSIPIEVGRSKDSPSRVTSQVGYFVDEHGTDAEIFS